MQLHIIESSADQLRAGYACPCGCRPSVIYQRAGESVHEGCCCGNEFAVGPEAKTELGVRSGFRPESVSFVSAWGEELRAAWLIGPSVHADDEHGVAAGHGSHDQPEHATAMDPVCGMTVDLDGAAAKGFQSTYQDRLYSFCGRGCGLEFDEDPDRYLDLAYVPSM